MDHKTINWTTRWTTGRLKRTAFMDHKTLHGPQDNKLDHKTIGWTTRQDHRDNLFHPNQVDQVTCGPAQGILKS